MCKSLKDILIQSKISHTDVKKIYNYKFGRIYFICVHTWVQELVPS